jgi:DNA-3-methyladenine glycosylase I
LDGYLEAMAWVVFISGMNNKVVDAKWEGIRSVFDGFDVERVAAMTPSDVDRLMGDPRVIRNRRKLEALVDDAATMLQLDREWGGFDRYLASLGDYDPKAEALKRNFKFMGDATVYFFLAAVGEQVPEWERSGLKHEGGHVRSGTHAHSGTPAHAGHAREGDATAGQRHAAV